MSPFLEVPAAPGNATPTPQRQVPRYLDREILTTRERFDSRIATPSQLFRPPDGPFHLQTRRLRKLSRAWIQAAFALDCRRVPVALLIGRSGFDSRMHKPSIFSKAYRSKEKPHFNVWSDAGNFRCSGTPRTPGFLFSPCPFFRVSLRFLCRR